MIPLLVFYIHTVAVALAFTRRYQEGGVGEGFLGIFFVALIFFVGWSISAFVMRLFLEQEGLGPILDRDALSLLALTIAESVFYYFFLKEDSRRKQAEDRQESIEV